MVGQLLGLAAKTISMIAVGLVLASCAGHSHGPVTGNPGGSGYLAKFTNSEGESHPETSLRQKLRYVRKLYSNEFPGRESLPDDHVLDPALAALQFQKSRNYPYALTWFGHSTFLIKMGSLNILTDPVLGNSIGHFPFKIRRMVPVLPRWQDIDHLDMIVISHGDYDHLDLPTLRKLLQKFPSAQIVVPSGGRKFLPGLKSKRIIELAWYQSLKVGPMKLTSVPAVHGVRRPPYPINSAHWAGYVFKDSRKSVYFSGDTGDGRIFNDIRRRVGRLDVAIVPAGAYAPQTIEKPFHATPEAAVGIAKTLGARLAVGMHWGTFSLSEDPSNEQKRRFLAAKKPSVRSTVFKIGETRRLQ